MSASSQTLAKRHGGICEGSMVKAIEGPSAGSPRSPSGSSGGVGSSAAGKIPEYCVLVGVRLTCYESWLCMDKGDHPTAIYSVVGASAASSRNDASFRIVTNQGTHLWCCPPSSHCRDVWLRALNAGLERQFAQESISSGSLKVLQPIKPRYHAANMKNPPCFCHSCGRLEDQNFPVLHQSCPLSQFGFEERMHLCPKCSVAQGALEHVRFLQELYAVQHQEQRALLKARRAVLSKLSPKDEKEEQDGGKSNSADNTEVNERLEEIAPTTYLQLTPMSHHVVSGVLRSRECIAYCRASPTLERLCIQFSQGRVGCMELVELLEQAVGIKDQALAKLKQEAFRVNGDMATALRLLAEYALPNHMAGRDDDDEDPNSQDGGGGATTELLRCILEFFLDLLEEGQLQSLAFFWPQLMNIHLQMLPPTDAASLQRTEIMEDFLLTVATQYSIHLAIELIWSHTADLEDAKSGLPGCAKRRNAVLCFLCELESLLFDFEGGWGGGTVTVGQFLAPSNHQVSLMKNSMEAIQTYRLSRTDRLSRSQRYRRLTRNVDNQQTSATNADESDSNGGADNKLEILAQEALRVAKNADYLSSHLAFTKRLCDIAERLRFLQPEERHNVLETELSKLNASGAMGGDPLNCVKGGNEGTETKEDAMEQGGLQTRVVRIPTKEGHVFRSKERTPVLLLVEVHDEGAEQSHVGHCLTPFPTSRPGTMDQEEKKSPEEGEEGKEEETPPESGEEEKVHAESENTSIEDSTGETDHPGASAEEGDVPTELPVSGDRTSKILQRASSQDGSESSHSAHERKSVELSATLSGPAPITPTTNKKVNEVAELALSGSLEGMGGDSAHSSRHALRRFDSPKGQPRNVTPAANKESVEAMVTNVVAKQLQLPQLMEPDAPASPSSSEEATSEDKKEATEEPEAVTSDSGDEANTPGQAVKASKVSALGTASHSELSKTGDARREVLSSLVRTGMSGGHSLAAGTATAMQRHLQDLERRRAVELLLTGGEIEEGTDRSELLKLGIRSANADSVEGEKPADGEKEDNEAMEAIRLLLIQYHVAQGGMTLSDAAAVLTPHQRLRRMKKKHHEGTMMHFGREFPDIDAGDVDPRLVGCGTVPPAVLQALTLWKANMITHGELLELVKKDLEFVRHSVEVEDHKSKLNEDSAFWGRFAFGERWAEKRSRIAACSPDSTNAGWDLMGIIVKSNDDLRQEAFVMQLIELCREAFVDAGLELWLMPYRILSTGRTTGVIEMVRNAMSFDALKKRPGYGKGGLREHLHRMTQFEADPGEAFKLAQRNFVRSLAAYSLLSYLFLFKDRHNGNLLLDTAGHVIHIDFGFVFGIAPGGSFSLEVSTPFKLTEEMIEVMDGLRSSLFSEFITLFCCGFLALQAHYKTFLTIVDITCKGSTFKCFEGRDSTEVVAKLEERFRPDLNKEESIAFCLDLIKDSTQSYGTAQYDYFQYLSQGIAT